MKRERASRSKARKGNSVLFGMHVNIGLLSSKITTIATSSLNITSIADEIYSDINRFSTDHWDLNWNIIFNSLLIFYMSSMCVINCCLSHSMSQLYSTSHTFWLKNNTQWTFTLNAHVIKSLLIYCDIIFANVYAERNDVRIHWISRFFFRINCNDLYTVVICCWIDHEQICCSFVLYVWLMHFSWSSQLVGM